MAMNCYEIRVKGHLGPACAFAFEEFTLCHDPNGETILTGYIADQAALHGVLMKIRDMGLQQANSGFKMTNKLTTADSQPQWGFSRIWRLLMNTKNLVSNKQVTISLTFLLIAALFVYIVLTNRRMPLISSTSGSLVILVILGFVMCTISGLADKVGRDNFSWFSPFVVMGILLGLTAIYVTFAGLTGRSLPFVSGEQGALILLASIIALKWILSRIHALWLG